MMCEEWHKSFGHRDKQLGEAAGKMLRLFSARRASTADVLGVINHLLLDTARIHARKRTDPYYELVMLVRELWLDARLQEDKKAGV